MTDWGALELAGKMGGARDTASSGSSTEGEMMAEVTNHDVLEAADALLHRLDLIEQLNEVLPQAETGDTAAMRKAADLYARTGRPQMATVWRKRAVKGSFTHSDRVSTAASTS